MLPERHRLRRRQDVMAVLKRGRLVRGRYVNFYWLKCPGSGALRLTTVVGKAVAKSAVDRHRFQRWIRQASQSTIQRMPNLPVDIVVVGRPSISNCADIKELASDIGACFNQISV